MSDDLKPAPILEPGASAPANAADSRQIRALPFLTHGACWFTFSLMLLVLRSSKDEVRAWLTVAMLAIVAIPYAVWFRKINRAQKPRVLVTLIAAALYLATSVTRRTAFVARRVWEYLRATDPFAKTIVFCADQPHAERMCQELVKLIPAFPGNPKVNASTAPRALRRASRLITTLSRMAATDAKPASSSIPLPLPPRLPRSPRLAMFPPTALCP